MRDPMEAQDQMALTARLWPSNEALVFRGFHQLA